MIFQRCLLLSSLSVFSGAALTLSLTVGMSTLSWSQTTKKKPTKKSTKPVKKKNLNAESQITIGYSYTPFNQTYLPIWINNFRKNNPNIKQKS